MAKIFTTPEAEYRAKKQMRYVLIAGGLQQASSSESLPYSFTYNTYLKGASKICDELVNRDFTNIDSYIYDVCSYMPYGGDLGKRFKPDGLAKAIVYFAELLQLYWDDTLKTPYEIDEFKKTTLGQAVYKYGRYISAIKDKATHRTASVSSGTTNSQTRSTGQPPQNNYKQSGPQSGNVRDLQGVPGQKVLANTSIIYKIIGDNPQSKNIPNVFIKPLSPAGATGSTNKIFISSGNGYTDCTCYFDEPNDAQDFLDKIIAANRVPANVSNLRVVKKTADRNGYFLVGTEFGTCAVSAKTLNEALKEAINDDPTGGWDKANEGASKEEVEELHTWMRRD